MAAGQRPNFGIPEIYRENACQLDQPPLENEHDPGRGSTFAIRARMSSTPLSLLSRLRKKPDQESWARLCALYEGWIGRIFKKAGVPTADADDLRQEVLSTLVRELPGFAHSGQAGAFRRWLKLIVHHRLLGYWRNSRNTRYRTTDLPESDVLADPDAELDRLWEEEHDRHITQALLKLAEPSFTRSTWQAFYRQVVEGRPAADVAAELGLSVNAVLLAKSRVLRQLRLEAEGLIDGI